MGEALNRVPQADALNATLSRRIAAVKARTAGKPAPRVLVPVWYDPIITDRQARIHQRDHRGRGCEVSDRRPNPRLAADQHGDSDCPAPEALLLIRGGKVSIDMLRKRPGWSSLPAIQKDKVYYVDNGIQEPSPVAIDALEELAREFHP